MMTNKEFCERLRAVATNYKTLYVMGCIGAPMTAANKARYIKHNPYNAQLSRRAMINAASGDTFGFDCVCLIKSILWGWNGDKNKPYGGAVYASNGVPDIGADTMITVCKGISTDFSKIEPGEAVWMKGHIGVYIGDGLAVECSPKWANRVQITACNCTKSGYNRRNWVKHGKFPYIQYINAPVKTVDEIAKEVISGKWGVDPGRSKKLSAAVYDAKAVQVRVNELMSASKPAKKSIDEIAKEVIRGKWGAGADRKKRLTAAGYDAKAVQKRVNEMLR